MSLRTDRDKNKSLTTINKATDMINSGESASILPDLTQWKRRKLMRKNAANQNEN